MAADLHIHIVPEGLAMPTLTEMELSLQQWVGEVSWLKASLFEDSGTFVPGPVEAIAGLLGDLANHEAPRRLTPRLIAACALAMHLPNTTEYSIESSEVVVAFLTAHAGARAVTISW